MPVEVPDPIPFDEDRVAYDSESVKKFWRILLSVDSVFHQFRTRFLGKSSPVQLFWGGFDLAVSPFSGAQAAQRRADAMTREAYSQKVSNIGFWPGAGTARSLVRISLDVRGCSKGHTKLLPNQLRGGAALANWDRDGLERAAG